jgi:predicted kinase
MNAIPKSIGNGLMSKINRELVILVGMQGSGKTFYCQAQLSTYERNSQDDGPRTYPGIVRRLHELLLEGVPKIVIDRTNPMVEQRRMFAEMARAAGYYLKIVYFDIPEEICRDRIRNRKEHPTLVEGQMEPAITAYESRLNMPQAGECDELIVLRRNGE